MGNSITKSLHAYFLYSAGGSGPLKSPLPTKLLLRWEDIQTDHLDVPAVFFHLCGQGLSQEPQDQAFTAHVATI